MRRANVQYGLGLNKYEGITRVENLRKKLWMKTSIVKLGIILISGILLGRVNLLLNQSDSLGIAPIGIAYLIAVVTKENRRNSLIVAIGIAIGYLTISSLLTDGYVYLVAVALVTIYYVFIAQAKNRKKELVGFVIILSSFFCYGLLVNKYELGVNITLCLIQTLIVVPIYYVIKYALNSLEEINTNYFFSSEEIVSIGIFLCLLVAGIGNVNISNYSIRNICALTLVLTIAYVGGATYGTMIGVSMGIMLGVASNDMMYSVAFFGVGGLIVGIFKDTGKIFSILSGIIIYTALALYSNAVTLKLGVEVLTSSVLFLCVPKPVFTSIEIEINPYRKKASLGEIQLNAIKEEFTFKLKELTSVLTNVSRCLLTNNDNENLLIKSKGSALVENLADRSCSSCENRPLCWEREFHQTFNSFQMLIQSKEEGKLAIPIDLQKRCIKNFTLLKNAEGIVTNYNVNESIRERLAEGRNILSSHITNISCTLDNLLSDFKKEVRIDTDLERLTKRILNKNSIYYNDIFCYIDKSGRVKIRLSVNNCEGADYYGKNIVSLLSSAMRMKLCIGDDGCKINPNTNECIITIEEKPRYYMVSYGAMEPKGGETQIGDSYSFGRTRNGTYMTILSDGMGSGPEAKEESKATVDLVEKLIEAGFDEDITVNTVNSIMGMRFSEDEKYATLDLNRIDLYNGNAIFVKIGAAPSFIKRGRDVITINSKNLPFGLVDEVDVEVIREVLRPGDILINVSDGILDIDKSNSGESTWIEEYLKTINSDPRELSEKVLERAKKLSDGTIKDDMTVVVSKVYLDS
ncbi:stage II sporulation protein E [Clostridium beijerinckii]|uniref:stage II sporulation protein E n=1 Tax=Clostridium beijerinckii TaxID=1520 RepID=UPI00098CD06D|nr:stage II sporulation protein E [Clostridium beijerinckii]NRT32315.1 stage II sporulation protein E [Clostridium beijerinckii]UYZ35159.1 stage II sporulation protein E [Clostridium beijerinckii]